VAILDSESNAVVIRVVYDGAPMAGKTTSVCALGKGLGAGVYSPAELNGRTLYFDWLDYTGGLFEGHRIRCQIVGAPGQTALAARRRQILESADVVVFVGDSTPLGFEADRAYLGSLCSVLRQLSGPPIGIVLQANKRDLPDAVPIGRMRSMLDGLGMKVGVVESVATEGSGIREAFVFAVRLALDRVRELMRTGELRTGKPEIDTADQLLEQLKRREEGSLDLAADAVLGHTRLSEIRVTIASQVLEQVVREDAGLSALPFQRLAAVGAIGEQRTSVQARLNESQQSTTGANRRPNAPNERVASGMVWPPIDGRMILQEIGSSTVQLYSTVDGQWGAVVNDRWRIHTPAGAIYPTVEEGRPALIQLARQYAANVRIDTTERCVALADDGQGGYRLWHIQRLTASRETEPGGLP